MEGNVDYLLTVKFHNQFPRGVKEMQMTRQLCLVPPYRGFISRATLLFILFFVTANKVKNISMI